MSRWRTGVLAGDEGKDGVEVALGEGAAGEQRVMPRGRDRDHDVRNHKRKSKFGVGNRRMTRSPEEHGVLISDSE